MKIIDLETIQVSIPYKRPEPWSFGIRKGTTDTIIKIVTDEGITGIGEAEGPISPLSLQTFIHNDIKPIVLGENPMNIERLMKKIEGNGMLWVKDLSRRVTCGIEMALWDIVGKVCQQPIYNLIGGCYRSKVEFGLYLFGAEPDVMAKYAADYVEKGFSLVKFKVGIDSETDYSRVSAIRNAVGSKVKLAIDANQAWTVGTAVAMINKLKKFDLFFVEQPTRFDDLYGMAQIRRAVNVPIGANESVTTLQSALAVIRAEAADIVVTDVQIPGGLLECKKISAVCEAANIPIIGHSGGELGVATSAQLHLVASTPNFIYPNDTYYPELADDIIVQDLKIQNGFMDVPKDPGLGVTLDDDKIAKYQSSTYYNAFMDESRPDWIPTSGRA